MNIFKQLYLRFIDAQYKYFFLEAWCETHGNIDRMKEFKVFHNLSPDTNMVVCPRCPQE